MRSHLHALSELGVQRMRKPDLSPAEAKKICKALMRSMDQLRQGIVLVEGQRDQQALQRLGCHRVYGISGQVRRGGARLADTHQPVVVLTDMDRTGAMLLEQACEELERYSIRCKRDPRTRLARLLRIKYFEHLDRAYEEWMENYKRRR